MENNNITDRELITAVAKKTGLTENAARKICEALFEEIFRSLEKCRIVTVQNFGTFYIKATEPRRTFKFNPSQRLRKSLGWSVK